jgi:hypothetical protein
LGDNLFGPGGFATSYSSSSSLSLFKAGGWARRGGGEIFAEDFSLSL